MSHTHRAMLDNTTSRWISERGFPVFLIQAKLRQKPSHVFYFPVRINVSLRWNWSHFIRVFHLNQLDFAETFFICNFMSIEQRSPPIDFLSFWIADHQRPLIRLSYTFEANIFPSDAHFYPHSECLPPSTAGNQSAGFNPITSGNANLWFRGLIYWPY